MPSSAATLATRQKGLAMGRAVFFAGRGPLAFPVISLNHDTSHDDGPTPALLATLPIGRLALTASTIEDYLERAGDLLAGWQAAGFRHGRWYEPDRPYNKHDHVEAIPECPGHDGAFMLDYSGTVDSDLIDRDFDLAYAFSDGRVWCWRAGVWHTITIGDYASHDLVTMKATMDLPVDGVRVSPASRQHGESYLDTWMLDLPQLAVWIMAELIAAAADPDHGLAPELRYAALVNPTRRELRLTVFGVTDDQREEDPGTTTGQVMRVLTTPIVHAHNWANPADSRDYRFIYTVTAPDERDQRRERRRRRGPGTVTVIRTDNPTWWR